jgi:hypothetical protein
MEVGSEGLTPLPEIELMGCASNPALAKRVDPNGFEHWTLLSPKHRTTRVNGTPVTAAVRVLKDQDAIAVTGGETLFFSAEKVVQILPYTGNDESICCIRCKLPLRPGTPTVRCPNPECGFVHHETNDRPCWTYAEGCAACGYPTDLEAGLQWSPEEL